MPASVANLLEFRLGRHGHDAIGFAVHVPHYLAQSPFPAAAEELLSRLSRSTGLLLPTDDLHAAAELVRVEVDKQVAAAEDAAALVRMLEQQYDAFSRGRDGENLLAAAGARRGREMAVSLALGARRWDLLRPRLLEALALALLSGGAGLLLATWTGDLMPWLLGVNEELAGINTQPDGRVVVFIMGMSLVTGLLIWMASALLVVTCMSYRCRNSSRRAGSGSAA